MDFFYKFYSMVSSFFIHFYTFYNLKGNKRWKYTDFDDFFLVFL